MKRIVSIISLFIMVVGSSVWASDDSRSAPEPHSRAWYYLQRQAQLHPQSQNNQQDEVNQNIQEQNNGEQLDDASEPQEIFERCPICLNDESLADSTLNCNHKFCESCISTWLVDHTNCPLCRQKDVYLMLDPKDHVFDFNREKSNGDHYTVPVTYQQEVRDFIASLTIEEYSALIGQFKAPEYSLSSSPAIVDQNWLPLQQRINLFRKDAGLSYDPSMIPSGAQYEAEEKKRFEQRKREHIQAHEDAKRAVVLDLSRPTQITRLSPANHVFDFNRRNIGQPHVVNPNQISYVVAPGFHQEVRDFIRALTDEEYAAFMNRYGGSPEYAVSESPEWLDTDWFSPEQRRNIFRRDMGLSFNRSVMPVENNDAYGIEYGRRKSRRVMANRMAALEIE